MKNALPGPITATYSWHGFVIGLSGSTGNRIDHERIGVTQPRVGIVSLCGEAQSIVAIECCLLGPHGPDNASHLVGKRHGGFVVADSLLGIECPAL